MNENEFIKKNEGVGLIKIFLFQRQLGILYIGIPPPPFMMSWALTSLTIVFIFFFPFFPFLVFYGQSATSSWSSTLITRQDGFDRSNRALIVRRNWVSHQKKGDSCSILSFYFFETCFKNFNGAYCTARLVVGRARSKGRRRRRKN